MLFCMKKTSKIFKITYLLCFLYLFQIKSVNAEVNGLIEKRMMRNDPVDDKFALFRQQASIIARKKEAAAESLSDAKDELQQCQAELNEKRDAAAGLEGEVLKGDEVCILGLAKIPGYPLDNYSWL